MSDSNAAHYCQGHRERYDGDRCPTCAERSHPGRRADRTTLRWPEWNTLAPCAGAVAAVMEAGQ